MKSMHTIVLPHEAPEQDAMMIESLFIDQLGHEPLSDVCEQDARVPELGGCGQSHCRHKTTVLVHAAPILVLHLLRFTWDVARQRTVKLNHRVDFECILPPLHGQKPYDLRAVVEHRGAHDIRSTEAGHYVAYVRGQNAFWYECDDARAPRRCDIEDVRRAQAYLLFYERRE